MLAQQAVLCYVVVHRVTGQTNEEKKDRISENNSKERFKEANNQHQMLSAAVTADSKQLVASVTDK